MQYKKEPSMTATMDDGILVGAGKVATSQWHLVAARKVAGKRVDAGGTPTSIL